MKVYCDTSTLVALATEEPAWRSYADWLLANADRVTFSSFGWGEFVDGAARRVRRHQLLSEHFDGWIEQAELAFAAWERIDLSDNDLAEATAFIRSVPQRALKLPDSIHLAVCRRLGATLLTGDRQQAAAATAFDIPSHLILPEPEA